MDDTKTKKKRRANGDNRRRRKNCTGTIEQRGDRFLARWYVYTPQGARVRQSKLLAASNLEDARKELAALTDGNALITAERQLEKNRIALEGVKAEIERWEDSRPSYTLAEAWDAFDSDEESLARDPATQRNYGQWFGMFKSWLEATHPEAKELRNISSAIAEEYSRHLKARVRGTTHNRHLNALALIWATLASKGTDSKPRYPEARLGQNPFAYDKSTRTGIKRVPLTKKEKPHRRRDLTLDEVAGILSVASGEMRVLLALGFYTGFRLGDCATLDWSCIDRVNMVIAIRSRKTDTFTETKINPALARIIEESITTDGRTGYLMPELAALYNGGTTGRVKLVRMIEAVFNAAGIQTSHKAEGDSRARPDAGFHSLRHTYITQLERLGATLEERRRLAGHRTAQMTRHYTHEDLSRPLMLPDLTATAAPAQIAAEPPRNAQEGREAAERTETPPDASDALRAFYAAFRALSPEERETAKRWTAAQ